LALEKQGYTNAQVAAHFGIAPSTWKGLKRRWRRDKEERIPQREQVDVMNTVIRAAVQYLPEIVTLTWVNQDDPVGQIETLIDKVTTWIEKNPKLSVLGGTIVYGMKNYIIPWLKEPMNIELLKSIASLLQAGSTPVAVVLLVGILYIVLKDPLVTAFKTLLRFMQPNYYEEQVSKFAKTSEGKTITQEEQQRAVQEAQESGNFWDYIFSSTALAGTSPLAGAGGR